MTRPLRLCLFFLAACSSGCAFTSRDRLASCEQRVQTLSVETDQLRKETLALRSRNRDLAQRSVDDARRLREAELTARRLEQAVASYQQERREITEAFNSLQSQVLMQAQGRPTGPQAALEAPSGPNPARFVTFARAQPGARFDSATSSWFFPADSLFTPGSAELSPNAPLLLDAFARLLADPADPATPSHIASRAAVSSVVRTSAVEPPSSSLSEARADRVRRELARRLDLEPTAIPFSGQDLDPDSLGDSTHLLGVEIELKPATR